MALEGEILRTVIQVTIAASGKYGAKFLQAMLRVIKSSVVEVSGSNFLVSKASCAGGETPICPKIHMQKSKVGQFTALLRKEYLKIFLIFFFVMRQQMCDISVKGS